MDNEVYFEPDYQEMTLREFLKAVRDGFYTDDDGVGVIGIHSADIEFLPSTVLDLPVFWYNK